MEVLFEYRGSRRTLTASSGEKALECVTTELHRIGRSRAQVYTANADLNTIDRNQEVYLLQKWSPQWNCYVDVREAGDISDGDKLAVVMKPKPPSKFLLLCCWCTGAQNEPQVQGVPRSKLSAVRKNEEIQSLDLLFNVESARHSRASDWEETHSQAHSEVRDADLNEGEQYVRAESGRASWKLVPMKSSESVNELPDEDDHTQVEELVNATETGENDSPPIALEEEQTESELVVGSEQQAEDPPAQSNAEGKDENNELIEGAEKPASDHEEGKEEICESKTDPENEASNDRSNEEKDSQMKKVEESGEDTLEDDHPQSESVDNADAGSTEAKSDEQQADE